MKHKHNFKTFTLTALVGKFKDCINLSKPENVRAIDKCNCGEFRTRKATKCEQKDYIESKGYGYDYP